MVGAHPVAGGVQARLTLEPLANRTRLIGAPGAPVHGGPPDPTTTVISLDAGLVPSPFLARTRTKYVPAGTFCADASVAALAVSKERSVRPGPNPTSITYDV